MRVLVLLCVSACATTPAHGTWSDRTLAASSDGVLCDHGVPERACVKHHPGLEGEFKRVGDWCGEHAVPESQCLLCHPDLTFQPLPVLPASADVKWLAGTGDAIGALETHAVPGKVTVVDFYADWCAPCRKVDAFMFELVSRRSDLAIRKANVGSWETALAREHLRDVPTLPSVVVFSAKGVLVKRVNGLDLPALQAAIDEASR